MTIIVTDAGFRADDWSAGFHRPDEIATADRAGPLALDLASDTGLAIADLPLERVHMIRIAFPGFTDGRGFSLARALRDLGFAGRLRAAGHLLADQYTMARRAGFDEVEIDLAMALRHPEADWLVRADWRDHDMRAALRQIDR